MANNEQDDELGVYNDPEELVNMIEKSVYQAAAEDAAQQNILETLEEAENAQDIEEAVELGTEAVEQIEEEQENQEQEEEAEAKAIEEGLKTEINNATKKATKEASKHVAKLAGATFKRLIIYLFTPPVLFFTLAVLLILLIIGMIFLVMASAGPAPTANLDPENGKFGTSAGITGEYFYGGRMIYLNPQQAQADLKDYYNAFSNDFIERIDDHQSISLRVMAEEITDDMATIIAKNVSGSEESLTLDQYLANVTHFGYTENQLANIKTDWITFIVDNQSTYFNLEEEYTTFEQDLNQIFNENYSNYNVTAPLYYAKDIIIGEEELIPSQDAQNYVAFMFMPKTDVLINSNQYVFYFPDEETEGYATNIDFKLISVQNNAETVLYETQVDSSWYSAQNKSVTATDPVDLEINLTSFESIDLNNPLNSNIYSLFLNENKLLKDNLENSILKLTNIADENQGDYIQISYLPANDSSYFYVSLNADGIFQFCEYQTSVE